METRSQDEAAHTRDASVEQSPSPERTSESDVVRHMPVIREAVGIQETPERTPVHTESRMSVGRGTPETGSGKSAAVRKERVGIRERLARIVEGVTGFIGGVFKTLEFLVGFSIGAFLVASFFFSALMPYALPLFLLAGIYYTIRSMLGRG